MAPVGDGRWFEVQTHRELTSKELGHIGSKRRWPIELPVTGGHYLAFITTPQQAFWWKSEFDLQSANFTDLRLRSLRLDGHREELRVIPTMNMFDADDQLMVWMDRSEGFCESDMGRGGSLWVAPLTGGPARRILGGQYCATTIRVHGDDIFWITEMGGLWWASIKKGKHLLVSGNCGGSKIKSIVTTPRWVYFLREEIKERKEQPTRLTLARRPWWPERGERL